MTPADPDQVNRRHRHRAVPAAMPVHTGRASRNPRHGRRPVAAEGRPTVTTRTPSSMSDHEVTHMCADLSTTSSVNDSTSEALALQPGALVDYHGTLRAQHGRYVVVDAAAACKTHRADRLVLVFWPDGDVVLSNAHPTSVTSVGQRVPLCTCGLPTTMHRPINGSRRELAVQNGCIEVHATGKP